MNITKTFTIFTLLSIFSTICFSAERERSIIYRLGESSIATCQAGSLTGALIWAASTSQTHACCIGYSVGAGICCSACIASTLCTYKIYKEYQQHQNALHVAREPRLYMLPLVQLAMNSTPTEIQQPQTILK